MWKLVWKLVPYSYRLRFVRGLGERLLPGQMSVQFRRLSPEAIDWAETAAGGIDADTDTGDFATLADLKRRLGR